MATAYRLLGPVEVDVDGVPAHLGRQPRVVLALLLLHAGQVVSVARLTDALWGDNPPASAGNILQGYVSQLRKMLGREAIETREPGYVVHIAADTLDLRLFERLAAEGTRRLEEGSASAAADLLAESLALWRGDALGDVASSEVLAAAAARLDELKLAALERRIEADLACGRHDSVVGELEELTREHPLRGRGYALRMLALYRAGRQVDALQIYRDARRRLVDELGLEPGEPLHELQQAILRHDPSLQLGTRTSIGPRDTQAVLVAVLALESAELLVSLASPLAGERELILASPVSDAGGLSSTTEALRRARDRATADAPARVAVFTSLTPGADLARLAREQDAALVVVDAPTRLLEDARLLALLDDAPCDVAVLVAGTQQAGPVIVPFTGADHDWAAIELGAWLARAGNATLVLAGSTTGTTGRDASLLLASASLAVQRVLGVEAEPLLVDPSPQSLVAATSTASVVVVGLTDRWRRDGVGPVRTALAVSPHHPTLLVRRGLRPSGLAPRTAGTQFTWTIGG